MFLKNLASMYPWKDGAYSISSQCHGEVYNLYFVHDCLVYLQAVGKKKYANGRAGLAVIPSDKNVWSLLDGNLSQLFLVGWLLFRQRTRFLD